MSDLKVKLKTTTKIVETLLRHDERYRNNDHVLYYAVILSVAREKGQDLNQVSNMPIYTLFLGLDQLGYPPFESVRRSRQKLQRKYPELRACERVQKYRADNEGIYHDYATN